MKICIERSDRMGDMILTLPVIQAIKEQNPQAIVHAMVNYKNGITTALLNKPDMRIPISSLFFKFNDYTNKTKELNLLEYSKLEFHAIDTKR